MCGILGVIITRDGVSNVHRKAKVLVANYTSTLDHLAIDLVMPNILVSQIYTRLAICNQNSYFY